MPETDVWGFVPLRIRYERSFVGFGGHYDTKHDNQVNTRRVCLVSDRISPPLSWSGRLSCGARSTAADPTRGEPGMSIKSRILAVTAALTVVGGLGTAGALSANAATPACGDSSINILHRELGTQRTQ